MAESLYDRYMAAAAAHRTHREQCTSCTPTERCETGQQLYAAAASLQDKYLAQLGKNQKN